MSRNRMEEKVDVLIVGGGAIGMAAAYYLQEAGRQVTVLEQGTIGGACSEKNAGLVVPSHLVPLAAPGVMSQGLKWMLDAKSPFYIRPRMSWDLLRWIWAFRGACSERRMRAAMPVLHNLLQQSHAAFKPLDEKLSLGFEERGMLITYEKEKGRKDCQRTAQLARESGLSVDELDESALRRLEPNVHSKASGGIFFPQDAHLDPALMVNRFHEAIKERDATILENTRVTKMERNGTQITRVHTDNGVFSANHIVVAGGAWSP